LGSILDTSLAPVLHFDTGPRKTFSF
jgi:hypothetical protein